MSKCVEKFAKPRGLLLSSADIGHHALPQHQPPPPPSLCLKQPCLCHPAHPQRGVRQGLHLPVHIPGSQLQRMHHRRRFPPGLVCDCHQHLRIAPGHRAVGILRLLLPGIHLGIGNNKNNCNCNRTMRDDLHSQRNVGEALQVHVHAPGFFTYL